MDVKWCPTTKMTGNYFTKPLQGALFKRFRDLIMGVMPHPEISDEKKNKQSTEANLEGHNGQVNLTSGKPGRKSRRHRSVLGNSGSATKVRAKAQRSSMRD